LTKFDLNDHIPATDSVYHCLLEAPLDLEALSDERWCVKRECWRWTGAADQNCKSG